MTDNYNLNNFYRELSWSFHARRNHKLTGVKYREAVKGNMLQSKWH